MTKVSNAEKVGMSSERLERIGVSMRSLIDAISYLSSDYREEIKRRSKRLFY